MMFQQFMQMGAPASFAIVGFVFSICGFFVAFLISGQVERKARRKHELDRIEVASRAKQIEHKGHNDGQG